MSVSAEGFPELIKLRLPRHRYANSKPRVNHHVLHDELLKFYGAFVKGPLDSVEHPQYDYDIDPLS
jgi:hypothetical protein